MSSQKQPASAVSTLPVLRKSQATSYSFARLLLIGLLHIGVTCARPLSASFGFVSAFEKQDGDEGQDDPKSPADPRLWIYLSTAIALVLLGGCFAGLTIALMGQDEVYLQVIAASGEKAERKTAAKVLRLLKRGKHWVLVTLLVGNVITNETLPIVLDRSIGGGYAAAISSTVLVIIFGEIVPQSICVRYGLPIGASFSSFVLLLMWLTAPITWPIAKLLDYLLGEDHGTTYKKAGLKTLVTLHKTLGGANGERLNEDEVSIISGVLDLKEKPVGSIMTPMNDVFTLPSDAILDEEMMDDIMREGYSRIPIHQPKNKGDFVGMLLVKMLITYDPEDARRVSEFALATLPETSPETSCLDIINFFQEGKSHMVLVSDYPGASYGALGVVTLEDVIEELIGEEIIDESDVFVDVHKAIRRIHPGPSHRPHPHTHASHNGKNDVAKGDVVMNTEHNQAIGDEHAVATDGEPLKENNDHLEHSSPLVKRPSNASYANNPPKNPKQNMFLMRRKSSGSGSPGLRSVQLGIPEMREAMKKVGPSNLASRPKQSRVNTIKVKPGLSFNAENGTATTRSRTGSVSTPEPTNAQRGIGEELLSNGLTPKDGVQAVHRGKGDDSKSTDDGGDQNGTALDDDETPDTRNDDNATKPTPSDDAEPPRDHPRPERLIVGRSDSHSTVGSLKSAGSPSSDNSPPGGHWRNKSGAGRRKKTTARSGSITENLVDSGGVKKLVLEMTSSNEDGEEGSAAATAVVDEEREEKDGGREREREKEKSGTGSGSRRRTLGGGSTGKKREKGSDENTPLLGKES